MEYKDRLKQISILVPASTSLSFDSNYLEKYKQSLNEGYSVINAPNPKLLFCWSNSQQSIKIRAIYSDSFLGAKYGEYYFKKFKKANLIKNYFKERSKEVSRLGLKTYPIDLKINQKDSSIVNRLIILNGGFDENPYKRYYILEYYEKYYYKNHYLEIVYSFPNLRFSDADSIKRCYFNEPVLQSFIMK